MTRHLAYFCILNIIGAALLVVGWMNGLLQRAIESDVSHISLVILAAFALGIWMCGVQLVTLQRDTVRRGYQARTDVMRFWLDSRISFLDKLARRLATLGFAGTVVGFLIAFAAFDPAALSDADSAVAQIGNIMPGISVALYTTLAGLLFGMIWLWLAYEIVEKAAARIYLGK